MHKTQARLREKPLPHITSVAKEQVNQAIDAIHSASANGRSLDDLIPQVADATQDLRAACNKGLEDAMHWLDEINNHRWKKHPVDSPAITVRQENVKWLKSAVDDFNKTKHLSLLEPFKGLFDEKTGRLKVTEVDKVAVSLRSLFRCFIFTSTYLNYAKTLINYLEYLLMIEQTSPENKLQFPGPAKFADDLIKTATDKNQNDADGMNINSPLNDDGRDSTTDPTIDGDDDDDVDEKRTKKPRKGRQPRQWGEWNFKKQQCAHSSKPRTPTPVTRRRSSKGLDGMLPRHSTSSSLRTAILR